MSKREFVGYRATNHSVHCEGAAVPTPEHREPEHQEIVQLIQQLRRGSELSCRPTRPVDSTRNLDIRVLPQTLAALAARQRT